MSYRCYFASQNRVALRATASASPFAAACRAARWFPATNPSPPATVGARQLPPGSPSIVQVRTRSAAVSKATAFGPPEDREALYAADTGTTADSAAAGAAVR